MKNKIVFSALFILLVANSAKAKDVYDTPEVTPIIDQLYSSTSELSFKMAYFPIGAFNKHAGLGVSYLNLSNPVHGWEVLSGYYFLEMPSGLKNSVIESFGAKANSFPVLKYMLKTGYTYVPFYSKSILFNSYLVNSRSYLNASAGIADFQIETPAFLSIGYGQNFYSSKDYGFKIEVDYLYFFKKSNYIQNQLTISFGLVMAWGDSE